MIIFSVIMLYILFPIVVFFTCIRFVKPLKWQAGETLTASIAASMIMIYSLSLIMTSLKMERAGLVYIFLISLLFIISAKSSFAFLKDSQIKTILLSYFVVNIWLLLFNGIIISYSGGEWTYDWYNHLMKSVFFYHSLTPDKLPTLPDRPPLMNLTTAYFWSILGKNYVIYQLLFSLLNSLCIIPLFLLGWRYSKTKTLAIPIVFFICFNPMFTQNATYAVTKQLAAFFSLSALYFYSVGWQDNHKTKFIFSWILLALGMLTHYSTVPYAIVIILHYLFYSFWRRQHKWSEFLICFISSFSLFASWLLWATYYFGIKKTFFSNPSFIENSKQTAIDYILAPFINCYWTIVPHFISGAKYEIINKQTSNLSYVRDYFFLLYQTNLYFSFGLIGLILIGYLLYKNKFYTKLKEPINVFWVLAVLLSFFVGMVCHGYPNTFGLMHICSQSLILLGLCYLACNFKHLPVPVKIVAIVFFITDVLLGIIYNMILQGFPHEFAKKCLWTVQHNWELKLMNKMMFLGDYMQAYRIIIWCFLAVFIIVLTVKFVKLTVLAKQHK